MKIVLIINSNEVAEITVAECYLHCNLVSVRFYSSVTEIKSIFTEKIWKTAYL